MRICRNGLCLFLTLPVNSPGNVRYSWQHLMCFLSLEGSCEGEEILPFMSVIPLASRTRIWLFWRIFTNCWVQMPHSDLHHSPGFAFTCCFLQIPNRSGWVSQLGTLVLLYFCYLSQIISKGHYCLPQLFGLKNDTKRDFSHVYGFFEGYALSFHRVNEALHTTQILFSCCALREALECTHRCTFGVLS